MHMRSIVRSGSQLVGNDVNFLIGHLKILFCKTLIIVRKRARFLGKSDL